MKIIMYPAGHIGKHKDAHTVGFRILREEFREFVTKSEFAFTNKLKQNGKCHCLGAASNPEYQISIDFA